MRPVVALALVCAVAACGSPAVTGTGTGPGTDGGSGPGTGGSVDAHAGGKVDHLLFAVTGDTRPPNEDDVGGYPTAIATGIYQALAKLNPGPQFVISTGDYMYASTYSSSTASQQMQMYMQAAGLISVPHWAVMGNHECTGYTKSNCPGYNETPNMRQFMSAMMAPIGETKPYYMRRVDAADGSWTAKFLFLAPNAWDSGQQSWLDQQLSVSTTYTFVIKHESSYTTELSSISTINSMLQQHPLTLAIVGHTHTWEWRTGEVIVGNGGAPMTSNVPYGYTLLERRSDGAIVVTAYDYTTGQSFETHAITAAGGVTN